MIYMLRFTVFLYNDLPNRLYHNDIYDDKWSIAMTIIAIETKIVGITSI